MYPCSTEFSVSGQVDRPDGCHGSLNMFVYHVLGQMRVFRKERRSIAEVTIHCCYIIIANHYLPFPNPELARPEENNEKENSKRLISTPITNKGITYSLGSRMWMYSTLRPGFLFRLNPLDGLLVVLETGVAIPVGFEHGCRIVAN